MRVLLIFLSVIAINSQHVNMNSSAQFPTPPEIEGMELGTGGGSEGSFIDLGVGVGSGTSTPARSRVVETKYGRVQGMLVKVGGLRNKVVEVYLGLPYASPPTKSHRFGPTQTAMPWEGVRDAIKPGFVCPQMMPEMRNEARALKEMPKGYYEYLKRVEPYLRNQSEDCLYLNIYSPMDTRVKPVVVWIHGGKFAWGSGNLWDGTVLAAVGDVIFITLNYRLNVLGFLNVHAMRNGKPKVSNYGLMDQIAALHWIKENIAKFNGDPENITLFGYEAGAACIHYLMASPAVTPGLFHRGILIAGSATAPWALVHAPWESALSLAQTLNCSIPEGNSSIAVPKGKDDPILECIKGKHFSEFSSITPPKFAVDFGPSIDGIVIRPNFRSIGESGMGKREVSKKYDILFGLSSLEKMTAFSEADLQSGFEGKRREAILRTLIRNSYRFHLNEILATVTNEYTDWEKDLTVSALTDSLALAPLISLSESSQVNRGYFYVFEHATKDGLYSYPQAQRFGGVGGEEINYMLGLPLVEALTGQMLPFIPPSIPSNYTKSEMALSELLLTFISNFAHTGDPNDPLKGDELNWGVSKERNRFRNTPWEPHDRLHQKYLEISVNKLKMRSHYRAHQMAIWLRLVPELERSGSGSTLAHNRMKGGNEPSLYVGKLREPLDEDHVPSILFHEEPSPDPPAPPTTCFSPSASSTSPRLVLANLTNGTESSTLFSPYSTALSVTIAVGCSLLILNVFIFALVYYQRDKKQEEKSSKYSSEPPELLKSNACSNPSNPPEHNPGNPTPQQLAQQALAQRGIVLSPAYHYAPTLPRSNGGLPKPPPPPRTNYSTLPHNTRSFSTNSFDELNV